MPLHFDHFKNNLPVGFLKDFHFQGLDTFKNVLEKDFFSKVSIHKYASGNSEIKLVVELVCDLHLIELLYHFNTGVWGGFQNGESSLIRSLTRLRKDIHDSIEIDEFSIFLKDTTIIVNSIYKDSIPTQLKNIFIELGQHYVHFTKGLDEIPYEIYVPVFEEGISEGDSTLVDIEVGNHTAKDYYSHWGLYFDSEDDALIYDLEHFSIVRGDLYMLNH